MDEVSVPPIVRQELLELLRGNFLLAFALFDSYPIQDADAIVDVLYRFYATNDLETPFLKVAVEREIRKTKELSSLLRLNTLATKLLTKICRKGKSAQAYLRHMLQKTVTRTVGTNQDLEVDLVLLKEKKAMDVEAQLGENMRKIDSSLRELLEDIFGSQQIIPKEIREICTQMRDLTQECLASVLTKSKRGEFVCVCSFFFLRFVCPALVSPHVFGLVKEPAPREASRQLLLYSKFITHLANLTSFAEDWMGPLNALLIEFQPKMLAFLQQLCSPSSDATSSSASASLALSATSATSSTSPAVMTSPSSSPSLSASGRASGNASQTSELAAKKNELNRAIDLIAKGFRIHRAKIESLVSEGKSDERFTAAESGLLRTQLTHLYTIVSSYPDQLVDLKGFPDEENVPPLKEKEKEKEKDLKEKELPKKTDNRKSRLLELLSLGIHKEKDIDRDSSSSPPNGANAASITSSPGDSGTESAKPKNSFVTITAHTSSPDLRNSRDAKKERRLSSKERPFAVNSIPLVPKFPPTVKVVNRSCIDDAEVLAWAAALVDRPDEEIRRAGELIAVLIDEVRALRGERHTHFRFDVSPNISPHPCAAGGTEPDRGRKLAQSSSSPRGSSVPPNLTASVVVSRERAFAESKPIQSVLPRRGSGSRMDFSPPLPVRQPDASTSPAQTSPAPSPHLLRRSNPMMSPSPPTTPLVPPPSAAEATTPLHASLPSVKLKTVSSMSKFKIEKRDRAPNISPAQERPSTGSTDGVSPATISPRSSQSGVTSTEYNPFVSPRSGNPFSGPTPRNRPASLNAATEKLVKEEGGRQSPGRASDPSPVAPSVLAATALKDQ